MTGWNIRQAHILDLERIRIIHNEGIEDRIATLDLEPHTLNEKESWFSQLKEEEFVLVCEIEDYVIGFAALTRYSPRKCYDGVGLLSIYIGRDFRGKGYGSRLLQGLIDQAKVRGYRKIVLRAFTFNQAGVALYEKMGFEKVGIHKRHGLLDGNWVDILVMELLM